MERRAQLIRRMVLVALACSASAGCWAKKNWTFPAAPLAVKALRAPLPDTTVVSPAAISSAPPRSLSDSQPPQYWDMSLSQVLEIALQNSAVVRDVGARVLSSPSTVTTAYDPSITNSDPRFGVDASLSEYDPFLESSLQFNKFDREINYMGRYPDGLVRQDLDNFTAGITKRNVNGSQIFARNLTNYDANNALQNRYNHSYDTAFELGAIQPLLRGRGETYNLVNGRSNNQDLLLSNGVLIARLNTNVSALDFEAAIQRLVSEVEDRYWQLSLTYVQLNVAINQRDSAHALWREASERLKAGLPGGELETEARAREYFFIAEGDVASALSGTRQLPGGVYASERRLREVIGLPPNDCKLIRPNEAPAPAKLVFDWCEVLPEALYQRVEVRRQKEMVKRRELQLAAARNLLLPTLDATGTYRFYGFGENLIGDGAPPFPSAFSNLGTGQFQEYQLGARFEAPLGFRQAKAGVRYTELLVSRERAVLSAQELQITHSMSAAMQELERSWVLVENNTRRFEAARQRRAALDSAFAAGRLTLEARLDGNKSYADADFNLYRAKVEYAVALKNLNLERGALLEYREVFLTDKLTCLPAGCRPHLPSVYGHEPELTNYILTNPPAIERSLLDQNQLPSGPAEEVPPGQSARKEPAAGTRIASRP